MSAVVGINLIRRDGDLQMRAAGVDAGVIANYAEAMRLGQTFPPVVLFTDGESFWLADGFHRTEAAIQAGCKALEANVRQGKGGAA